MAVLSGTSNVNENGPAATDDVTSGTTTILYATYVDRGGTTQTNVPIPAGGLHVLTHYGTLDLNQDGTYSYTPDNSVPAVNALNTGGTLSDPFSYQFDTTVVGDEGTTTIVIQGQNDLPVATNNQYTGTEDAGPITGNVITDNTGAGVDSDPDGPAALTASVVSNVSHGVLTFNPDGSFSYTPAANYSGTDSFTYHDFDGTAFGNTATVTFTVNPDAPNADPYVAVDDGSDPGAPGESGGFTPFVSQAEDTSHTYTIGTVGGAVGDGNFLANDQNPDGDAIHVDSISNLFDAVTGLQVGTVTYNEAAQTYTITPNANYNGDAFFDYVATDTTDSPNQSDTGRVFVQVTAVNDAPVLGDGPNPGPNDGATTASGTEDQVITGAVPAASDIEGDTIHYQLVAGSVQRNGVTVPDNTITFNPDGTYSYDPTNNPIDQQLDDDGTPRNQNVITFQYQAVDNGTTNGNPAPATSAAGPGTITINGVNDAPVAHNDSYTATEDTTLPADASRNVLTNDTDVESDPLTANPVVNGTTTGGGHYTLNANGTFSYTPAANYSGTDTFTYTANDGTTNSAPATVSIQVGNTPDAPVAHDDGPTDYSDSNYWVTEDVPNQAQGLTPGAGNAGFRTPANGFFTESSLLANDTDPDPGAPGNLDITSVGAAQGGTVQLVTIDGVQYVVFTPTANYSGPAGFDYAVTDPTGNSDIGHVTLAVQENSDGGPTAVDDTLQATELTTLHITAAQLVANDIDPDNNGAGVGTDQLVVRAINSVTNGTVSNIVTDANGNIVSFDFTPNSHVNGASSSFDYVVDDAAARANYVGDTAAPGAIGGIRTVGAPDTRSGTDIGTVHINVTNVNDRPVANNDTLATILEDSQTGVTFTAAQLLLNDTDADNNGNTNAGLTANIPTGHVHGGTITQNSNGSYTFIPDANFNGNATFTYTVTDNSGASNNTSNPATVTIPVTPVNDAPVANDDVLTHTDTLGQPVIAENRPSTFNWSQFLANDTDVDGDTLVITGGTSPQGTVTVDSVNHTLTFTPTTGYVGPATIDYTVSDGNGGTDVGTASFTVNPTVVGGGTGETLTSPNGGSAVINGNGGDDVLNGTPQTDELNGGDGNDTLNGLGADDFLRGGLGNDTANGGDGNDMIYMDDGGNDTANGGNGNDGIYFGAALTAADTVDGGAGTDTLALRGNYGAGTGVNSFLLGANNLTNIETLLLASGANTTMFPNTPAAGPFNYFLTEQDANVAAGQTLTIVAGSPAPGVAGLGTNENVYFDGSDEKDGNFRVFAGHGTDTLIGGQGSDGFFFDTGAFTSADSVDGRGGTDSIALRGDYHTNVALTNVTNVEVIALLSGYNNPYGGPLYGGTGPAAGSFDYNLTLANGNVTAGHTLMVNGSALQGGAGGGETVTVDGTAVTNGNLTLFGGAAADNLRGGLQGASGGVDLLYGGLGGDTLAGGNGGNQDGTNVFMYRSAAESGGTQAGIDHIVGFNYQSDKLDINEGGPATNGFVGGIAGLHVTDVNAVFGGTFHDTGANNGVLDDSEFFSQLASQLDNALNPGQAAFLQVTGDFSGQYNGSTIFVADTNGNGSVDASDLIIVFDAPHGQLPPTSEFIM